MPNDYDFVDKHAHRVGIDSSWMRKIMRVESGGNANARTGSYKGLFQLSESEFRSNGGTGSIYDPEQNTLAAANKISREAATFQSKHGRKASLDDIYMIHQQGAAGYDAHLANPDGVAWQNVRKYYSSDKVAKAAIWGNMTPTMKARYGSVENVTSQNFTHDWGARVDGSPEAVVSRGRPGVQWHRSRGEPEGEPEPKIEPVKEKPQIDISYQPVSVPQPHITAPEAPSVPLRPVKPAA